MLLALNVDIVAIAEVIAFATASYIDKTMNGLAFAEGMTDVPFGFFHRNLSGNDQLDVEILWVVDFFLCHIFQYLVCKDMKSCDEFAVFWEES